MAPLGRIFRTRAPSNQFVALDEAMTSALEKYSPTPKHTIIEWKRAQRQDPNALSFVDLPTELRDAILEIVVLERNPYPENDPNDTKPHFCLTGYCAPGACETWSKKVWLDKSNYTTYQLDGTRTRLLQTCHQIHHEGTRILYSKEEIRLHYHWIPAFVRPDTEGPFLYRNLFVGPMQTYRHFVKSIVIAHEDIYKHDDGGFTFINEMLCEAPFLASHFPNLKNLTYMVYCSGTAGPSLLAFQGCDLDEYAGRIHDFMHVQLAFKRQIPKQLDVEFLVDKPYVYRPIVRYDADGLLTERVSHALERAKVAQDTGNDQASAKMTVVLREQCPEKFLKYFGL
ncbi:hypothetical protein EJ08DRAFT_676213 [Tothia fuscella]|uniref:Uncharacterized protein n=1 Tax=Tothia fuscella TaxID=1048955 RepID=A0A9P4U2T7_9PEZI|nr:hypothetical protein EJ08DRAFT_676213 [Tothia fuscella]